MGTLLFYVAVAVATLAGVLLVITVIGIFLAPTHQVARSVLLKQTPEAIWQVVSDFANVPKWHPGVLSVERLPERNGHQAWRENYKGGYPIQLETMESVPPRRLVREIIDEGGPFRGRWEFDIAPVETGSRITIIEYGEIKNPFFRFMARAFMNPAVYLEAYLSALASKFGEIAKVEK